MNSSNPYFSLSGLAFQTPGDDTESGVNTRLAMNRIHAFVMTGGSQRDAMEALAYLEDKYPKLEACCDHMRIAFLLDDFESGEEKQRIARKAYNCLVDRLNGTPLR